MTISDVIQKIQDDQEDANMRASVAVCALEHALQKRVICKRCSVLFYPHATVKYCDECVDNGGQSFY